MVLALLLATAVAAPKAELPPFLSQTGLFAAGSPEAFAAGVRPFSPQYPLWSDGATKRRWVSLPDRAVIDAKDPESWVFPVGTRFWKEFSFNGRKVETRFLEKLGRGRWRVATYAWDEAQREARLVSAKGLPGAAQILPGVTHDLPSHDDCRACHEGQGRDWVLGFTALQLSPDRDPNAAHAEPVPPGALDLSVLLRERVLRGAPRRWADAPPRVVAKTPTGRAALGYLHANCAGCHNENDPVSSVGLSLRVSLLARDEAEQPGVRTTLGVKSHFQTPGLPHEECLRVFPGDAEKSALVFRMRARNPMHQMPPLGTKLVDTTAVELLVHWLNGD